jgi:exopolyphosphatase/guanosine-5'-triphosphate,3'-diphosphate pyrophosphatase
VDDQASFFRGARPSFRRAEPGDSRIAVVDVGSNSIRLVVFDRAERAPSYFFNEKLSCGLGARLAATGRLDPEGRVRALALLRRFAALAERMRVAALDAIATAAVREAEDGPDFVAQVERETGLRLQIVAGDEEARLSGLGVLLAEPDADGAMADMGGASMELARLSGGEVRERITLGLGPQRLNGLTGEALLRRIDDEIARGAAAVDGRDRPLYLVGGAWRALAKLQMARTGHPLQVLHGYRLTAEEGAEAAAWATAQQPDALRAVADVSGGRATAAPTAALVLGRLIAGLKPESLFISAYGLREGVYHARLPAAMRRLDPLLEACRRLEATQARFPGFGAELASFVAPVIAGWSPAETRLARAACLLNDVNWRAHPDYRPVGCFETVTRANLTGLDHADRVFIGFALMNRYGGGKRSEDVEAALALLPAARRARAKALGRALRLGAMLSASTPGALDGARLTAEGGALTLTLGPEAADLAGEVVARRLGALADSLGLTPRIAAEAD